MSIEVKPGRWRMRNGETAIITDRDGVFSWPWQGYHERDRCFTSWAASGRWGPIPSPYDLVEYLGGPQAMTEEQINYHRAADVVAKMTEQLLMLKMQMPVNLALALRATASSLEAARAELSRWQARLEQPVDIGAEGEVTCEPINAILG